jgi:pyruvate/2-oxoglutarate dehydrogenase complex dihydrolipoamide acyltransferase (E2) component
MKIKLKLIRVGMTMQEATIAEWFKKPGDIFAEGDALYAIETEKVTQDVLATNAGRLNEILVPQGAEAKVGEAVCVIDTDLGSGT